MTTSELSNDITTATRLLRAGYVVAFPTETVYGLGANAANPRAVRRIFEIKGRPPDHPLIVHLPDADRLDFWAGEIPDAAWRLTERFWPGPLTIILKRRFTPLEVTGGQDTVALRVPDHPVAQALLHAFGGALVAPSANRFGRVSPTTAEHVREELGVTVDMIVDGGPCRVGLESTILSLVGDTPMVLRPGAVSHTELENALDGPILQRASSNAEIRAPGMLASHYAPATQFEVWPAETLWRRADDLAKTGSTVAIMTLSEGDGEIGQNAMLSRVT
ncbi:MAG: L-threonylcarbamoyladenylate synthase, partial [Pseudomonadota bacterium]